MPYNVLQGLTAPKDQEDRKRRNALTGLNTAAQSVTQQYLQQNRPTGAAALGFSPDVAQFLGYGMGDYAEPPSMEKRMPDPVGLSQRTRSATAAEKVGAEKPGYNEEAALGEFRRPAGETPGVGMMAPGLRMKGDGTHWSGGPAVELSDQESAAYEAAKQGLKMQALGLRGAVEMKRGEAEDAREAEKSISEQIRNLEKRKRQMGKALGDAARSVDGSKGSGRWGGWIDAQKGKIDTQIAALRREMREGKVRAMTLGEVAKATETDLKGLELGMDRAALAAVFDLRAAGQQQAQAQQAVAAEQNYARQQENYAREQDQRKWTGEQEKARFDQDTTRRDMQIEALEKAIGLVDKELTDEKQSFTKEGKAALTTRRSALQESLLKALEETEAGASQANGTAGAQNAPAQRPAWEALPPDVRAKAEAQGWNQAKYEAKYGQR